MNDFRSALSRARGLGSAKEGTTHFWRQRLSALLLIPLVIWFAYSLASLPLEHARLLSWVQQPPVAIALILFIVATFYHAQLGLQVVIEDYVSSHARRILMIILVNLLCMLCALIGVVSVLKIMFGA